MPNDYRRVQDLALVVARWLLLGALLLSFLDEPDAVVPLPLVAGLGLYSLFLTIAFYFAYRPEVAAECGPDGECPVPASRRTQRISLWVVTVLTLLMATYPRWSSLGMAGAPTAQGFWRVNEMESPKSSRSTSME